MQMRSSCRANSFWVVWVSRIFDKAIFFILNHAADLRIVPRFPGSDILYKYNHPFELRFISGKCLNSEIPNTPEGFLYQI